MRKYELVVIFDASLEEETTEKEISKLTSLLEKEKCTISDIDRWGVRKLAYPINKQENGYYVIIYFTGTGEIIPELERINRINDRVLRHMVVKVEE